MLSVIMRRGNGVLLVMAGNRSVCLGIIVRVSNG